MELTENFLKLLQIAFIVIGLLTIFLIFIQYSVTVIHNEAKREAYVLGDALLASECLALTNNGNVVKALFSKEKLDIIESDSSCIKYPNVKVDIELINCGTHPNCGWSFELNGPYKGEDANFILAIKMNDNSIEPARMVVTI